MATKLQSIKARGTTRTFFLSGGKKRITLILSGLFAVLLGSGLNARALAESTSIQITDPADLSGRVLQTDRLHIGQVVHRIPSGHRTIAIRNRRYFYSDGVFFLPIGNRFRVVAAPHGVMVRRLPKRHTALLVHGRQYYFANGTFYTYKPRQKGFVVTKAPIGAVVYTLPVRHQHQQWGGRGFVEYGGVQYRIVNQNGRMVYRVVKHLDSTPEPRQRGR